MCGDDPGRCESSGRSTDCPSVEASATAGDVALGMYPDCEASGSATATVDVGSAAASGWSINWPAGGSAENGAGTIPSSEAGTTVTSDNGVVGPSSEDRCATGGSLGGFGAVGVGPIAG